MKIGYLVSGNLGLVTMQELSDSYYPAFIVTDRGSDAIIRWSQEKDISVYVGRPSGPDFDKFMENTDRPDLLVSINFLFLVDRNLLNWPRKIPINIHGSLLPKYRGRAPHIWAIINGESTTGITVHVIDDGCDTGDILYQESIEIAQNATGGDILAVFQTRYSPILMNVIRDYMAERSIPTPQDHSLSSYFGKRSPLDGLIDWSWPAEQIKNWVRALTYPYPAAFSMIGETKIKILSVQKMHHPIDVAEKNGLILRVETDCFWVKCADSVINVCDFELERKDCLFCGDILE